LERDQGLEHVLLAEVAIEFSERKTGQNQKVHAALVFKTIYLFAVVGLRAKFSSRWRTAPEIFPKALKLIQAWIDLR
jgi:hypothetical protein